MVINKIVRTYFEQHFSSLSLSLSLSLVTAPVLALLFTFSFFLFPSLLLASTTSGIIDSTSRYAWSENMGWIDFGTSEGAVNITDSALSGYAWSETTGWISLDCSNTSSCATVDYKVANNGEGTLSGYAYGENIGWIQFAPTGGGVTIDSSGDFAGYAWGENTGWIVFNCSTTSSCGTVSYKVNTDWRPQSARPACNNSLDDDGDGQIDYPSDTGCESLTDTNETNPPATSSGGSRGGSSPPLPRTPEGGYVFFITPNPTTNGFVTLHFVGGQDITKIQISDNSSFSPATHIDYVTSIAWTFQSAGEKTLYARYCNQYARCSEALISKVIYSPPLPLQENTQPSFIDKIIPDFLKKKPLPEPELEQPVVKEEVTKAPPQSLGGDWKLLSNNLVYNFVLAPLPSDIAKLIAKFPELANVFARLGITKISDLEKLKNTSINLPVIANKKNVPSEILIAEGGQGLITLGSSLALTSAGEVQQKIEIIAGKPIILSVKPESEASSIKGYLLFKQRADKTTMEVPMNSQVASVLLARVEVAQISSETPKIETELLVQEFEYTDPDGDGIFTAEISAPIVDGEYEVLTVINYKDKEKGSKEIRMITVVDPEGYVYEKNSQGKEVRLDNIKVSIFSILNDDSSLWDALKYNQDNPQITDNTGKYSFLVPPGKYYITAEAKGYKSYKGDEFDVKEGTGIHFNIEMTENGAWFKALIDWKMFIIIIFGIALLVNFINDRRRGK